MWFDMDTSYFDMYNDDMRRTINRIRNGRNATVVHHETCPCCGRKLVNLYRREVEKFEKRGEDTIRKKEKVWKCKVCWDKNEG